MIMLNRHGGKILMSKRPTVKKSASRNDKGRNIQRHELYKQANNIVLKQ